MTLVTEYNKNYAHRRLEDGTALPTVEVLRSPIVAGGTFMNPHVTAQQTALSLLWGYQARFADDSPEMELMPDPAMDAAYKEIQDNVGPESDMLYQEIDQNLAVGAS
mmetsp:Transcript_21672/g.49354  ORF Transcript_21672/g.49354 Transcript_21672/m.49354 type:complete len:107 (+) Transcript_21672:1-321(+)